MRLDGSSALTIQYFSTPSQNPLIPFYLYPGARVPSEKTNLHSFYLPHYIDGVTGAPKCLWAPSRYCMHCKHQPTKQGSFRALSGQLCALETNSTNSLCSSQDGIQQVGIATANMVTLHEVVVQAVIIYLSAYPHDVQLDRIAA